MYNSLAGYCSSSQQSYQDLEDNKKLLTKAGITITPRIAVFFISQQRENISLLLLQKNDTKHTTPGSLNYRKFHGQFKLPGGKFEPNDHQSNTVMEELNQQIGGSWYDDNKQYPFISGVPHYLTTLGVETNKTYYLVPIFGGIINHSYQKEETILKLIHTLITTSVNPGAHDSMNVCLK